MATVFTLPDPFQCPMMLVEQDYIEKADELGCELAAIQAVAEVESPKGAFLPDWRPTILFEAHIFAQKTGGRFNKTHPTISSPKWNKALYRGGAKEYDRLKLAMTLDTRAALQSASWGRFQVMGFNHAVVGYTTVEAFVLAMYHSERKHLDAFVAYVRSRSLGDELRRRDFVGFAYGYNGARHAENDYAGKMARAYTKYKKQGEKAA